MPEGPNGYTGQIKSPKPMPEGPNVIHRTNKIDLNLFPRDQMATQDK
jgi:hypothetical protein